MLGKSSGTEKSFSMRKTAGDALNPGKTHKHKETKEGRSMTDNAGAKLKRYGASQIQPLASGKGPELGLKGLEKKLRKLVEEGALSTSFLVSCVFWDKRMVKSLAEHK